MGDIIEFNWVLKLRPEQGFPEKLEEGKVYVFRKEGHRVYPIQWPIRLVDKDWNVRGMVKILEYTVKVDENTGKVYMTGKFKVVKVFKGDEIYRLPEKEYYERYARYA